MVRLAAASLFAASCALFAAQAAGAGYPERPIRLIVPFPPGGGVDINGRILADALTARLGQSVVVDNRPGASSIIGTEIASKSTPDGHTLLISAITMSINAALYRKLPFDIQRDFAPISLVSEQPNIVVANPALPAKTLKEFVALARSQPNKYTFGSPGPATGVRLAAELLIVKVGVKLVHVPYKGVGPALTGLLGNEINILVSTFASALPLVKSGRLHAYGVTTAKRAAPLPDVPTLVEAGVPGYEYSTWYGLLAPVGTPRPILAKLHGATIASLNSPEVKRIFDAQGLTSLASTPAEFARYLRSEIKKWKEVVQTAQIARL
jgi:tripartite-type tricarboxylate transporter receptor subunit TctC